MRYGSSDAVVSAPHLSMVAILACKHVDDRYGRIRESLVGTDVVGSRKLRSFLLPLVRPFQLDDEQWRRLVFLYT